MSTNKKGYCSIYHNKNNKYLLQIVKCNFVRTLDSKEEALKIKEEYLKYGLDYVKEKYPPTKTGRLTLTYDVIVSRLKEKFPDNMVGINKIIKVYKEPKIYENPKTHNLEKYFFATIECTKCHKRRKVNIRNILYSPKSPESSRRNPRSHSCICQNITFFKKDYIGKVYGDFKIIDIIDTRKNFASKASDNPIYRLAKVECINCHTQQMMTFSALVHPSKSKNISHFCLNCHSEQATITNQIKTLQSIYKPNSSIDDLSNNKSYVKGVWFDKFKQKWCARISEKVVDPTVGPIPKTRHYFLGEFNTYEDAVAARMYAVEHKLETLHKLLESKK